MDLETIAEGRPFAYEILDQEGTLLFFRFIHSEGNMWSGKIVAEDTRGVFHGETWSDLKEVYERLFEVWGKDMCLLGKD